jgi:hypothetical protein
MPKAPDYITVDGEVVTLPHGSHDVTEVLAAAEVNSQRFDLIRVDRDGTVLTHFNGDRVVTAAGDEFVTAAISASTA